MNDPAARNTVSTKSLALRLGLLAVGMFGFGFLLVPAYDAFCEITGFGGKTNQVAASVEQPIADEAREIDLEFMTTVNEYAPFEFRAPVERMAVHPGGIYEVNFVATNLTDAAKTAQAVPSVAPPQAAKYFKKLDCFCFTAQEFTAGETKEMPVRFIIDSDLPDFVDTITLSYTFFDTAKLSRSGDDAPHSEQRSR